MTLPSKDKCAEEVLTGDYSRLKKPKWYQKRNWGSIIVFIIYLALIVWFWFGVLIN